MDKYEKGGMVDFSATSSSHIQNYHEMASIFLLREVTQKYWFDIPGDDFLSSVGVYCKNLKFLDVSYTSISDRKIIEIETFYQNI